MGRWLMIAGGISLGLGAVLHFAPWLLGWFGKLPGDIRIETEQIKVFIPITSMALLSLIVTVLVNLIRR